MRRHLPAAAGFSLLEALVALTLIALVAFATMALIFQVPAVERRLDAHEEVLTLLEAQLEVLRANPIVVGEVDTEGLPLPDLPAAGNLRMRLESESLEDRGLYRLTLAATYSVGARHFEQKIETMMWMP
jgi:hypothetical protein